MNHCGSGDDVSLWLGASLDASRSTVRPPGHVPGKTRGKCCDLTGRPSGSGSDGFATCTPMSGRPRRTLELPFGPVVRSWSSEAAPPGVIGGGKNVGHDCGPLGSDEVDHHWSGW